MQVGKWLTLLFVLSLLGGCSPAAATVSGEVTVDGQPLKKGFIVYSPADQNGIPMTAEIENGAYTLKTVAGPKFVQISGQVLVEERKDPSNPDAPPIPIWRETLPDRYHSKSQLTFDVKPGKNTKDWSVESVDRKP
jgi:hypothetical protein